MKTLRRTVLGGVSAGDPLPDPFPIFAKKRAVFRRGAIQLIAGPPGSMKTVTILNIVKNMGPIPTLYFSSDSDDFTIASRLLARESGQPTEITEVWLRENPDMASQILQNYDHVKWVFDPAPTLEKMYNEAEAFYEIHGEYPHHIIIDILMDVDTGGEVDMNLWSLMADLKVMARELETSLTLIHHTSESAKCDPCPPRSAIMGKASQLPTLIITCWGDSIQGNIKYAIVKNRFGPQDPSGRTFFELDADASICQIVERAPEVVQFHDGAGVAENLKVNNTISWDDFKAAQRSNVVAKEVMTGRAYDEDGEVTEDFNDQLDDFEDKMAYMEGK